MKRILSVIMIAVLLVGMMAITASAAGAGTIRLSDANAQPGETVEITVTIENNPGVMYLSLTPVYNASSLKLEKMESHGSGWYVGAKAAIWDGANDESFTGKVLTLTFTVLDNAADGEVPVSLEVEAGNYNEEEVNFDIVPGTVTIGSAAAAEVYGCSLSLAGNIGLNFYLTLPESVTADDGAYVTLNGTKVLISEAETKMAGGETLYKFSARVAAKQMNDTVTLRLFDGSGKALTLLSNGEDVTEGYRYTVREYIAKAAEGGNGEKLTALVKAMSDYGSYAQAYFGYKAEGRAALYGDVSTVTAADLTAYKAAVEDTGRTGLRYEGSGLLLESETAIRHYFKVESGSIGDYRFLFYGEELKPVQSGESWYVEIPNVPAKMLDRSFLVTVEDSEGTAIAIHYGALSYAQSVLQGGGDAALQDLVKAMYLYNQAAKAYFGN